VVETATFRRTVNKDFAVAIDFKNKHYILPEYGTLGPKHVVDAHFMLVWIKFVNLVSITKGVNWYKNARNGEIKIKLILAVVYYCC